MLPGQLTGGGTGDGEGTGGGGGGDCGDGGRDPRVDVPCLAVVQRVARAALAIALAQLTAATVLQLGRYSRVL